MLQKHNKLVLLAIPYPSYYILSDMKDEVRKAQNIPRNSGGITKFRANLNLTDVDRYTNRQART